MAEFYDVLKRAVGSLPANTGDGRRAVYERARKALIAQLEGFSPPLTPSEITSQRLSLEEAIRKVEGEAARSALGLGQQALRPPSPRQPEAAGASPSVKSPAPPVVPDAAAKPAPRDSVGPPARDSVNPPRDSAAAAGNGAAPKVDVEPGAAKAPPKTAPASKFPATMPPLPGAPSKPVGPPPAVEMKSPSEPSFNGAPDSPEGFESDEYADYPPEIGKSRLPLIAGGLAALLIVIGVSAVLYSQRDLIFGEPTPASESVAETPPAGTGETDAETAARPSLVESPPEKSSDRIPQNGAGRDVRTVPTQRVIVPSGTENGALNTGSQTTDTNPGSDAGTAGSQSEIALVDPAVPTPAAPPAQTGEAGAVTQTAILYEEGTAGATAGNAVNGQVVWGKGKDGAVSAVLADVTIPDKGSSVKITIKPNTEDGFPASHLVEMQFTGPLGTAIRTVPGLILKATEQSQGDALVGAAIKVTDGLFWIALSAEEKDLVRNRSLLEGRGWIDIPLLYASGKRAILTVEKGVPGDDVIVKAFQDWAAN